MKKKIEIKTFLDFSYVSNPRFSPDNTMAAFVVKQPSEKDNSYKSNLYLLEVESKKVKRLTSLGDAGDYLWTAEGTLLFAAKRTKEEKESEDTFYYELDPKGGEALPAFSVPLQVRGIKEIDGEWMAIAATQNNGQPLKDRTYEIFEESPFWFNGAGYTAGLRTRLYLYNKKTQELKAITEPWFNAGSVKICGHRLLFSGYIWEKGPACEKPGLYLYDMDADSTVCLMEENLRRLHGYEWWSEDRILLMAVKEGDNPGMAYSDFWTMDRETGEIRPFAEYDASVGYGSVGSDAKMGGGQGTKLAGDMYYFITTLVDGAYLRSIDIHTGEISDRLTPDGSLESFDINEDHLLTCGMYGNKLAELYLDGEQVTHCNDDFEAEYDIRTPEYHSFVNSDGVEIHGWALTPAGYQKGESYPCILHIHGGPMTVFGTSYHHEMQLWANAGYFVIFCNPRGSDGRGYAFSDICDKYGTVDYQDIMEFTDEMLRVYPDIDPERVGVTGGSYGGFMTNWIIGHTNRFKAACSQRSIANWTVFEHTSDIGPSFTRNHQGSRTRDNVDQLWEHSPLKYAANCVTPTLFIHSDRDYRCWMAEGISMFNALQMNGCDSRLALFHEETHELSRSGKPKNRISRMEEILNWMDKYLK